MRGLEIAERLFPPERRAAVAQFHGIPVDDPALMPYLSWCAALKLSPTSGHVWLIPKTVKPKDGAPKRTIYKPAIGRDGLLQRARMTKGLPGGYRGMQSAVLCEHDTFEVEYGGDIDTDPRVVHKYAPKPTEFAEGESPGRWRGKIIGAWAKAYVDGEPPTFYYADLKEHGQLQQVWDYDKGSRERKRVWLDDAGKPTFAETGRPKQEWSGAWEYTSAMALKSAQSYVLRIALGVTGVEAVDEMHGPRQPESNGIEVSTSPELPEPDWGDDEELAESLKLAFDRANQVQPGAYLPQKINLLLAGADSEELRRHLLADVLMHAEGAEAVSGR